MRSFLTAALIVAGATAAMADIKVTGDIVTILPEPWHTPIALNETVKLKITFNVTLDGIDQEEADAEGGAVYFNHEWKCMGQGGVIDGTDPTPNPSGWISQNYSTGWAHWTEASFQMFGDACKVKVVNPNTGYENVVERVAVRAFQTQ